MYTKYAMRKAMDIATLGVAMTIKVNGDILEDIKIGYGVLAATPIGSILEEKLKEEKYLLKWLILLMNFIEDINP